MEKDDNTIEIDAVIKGSEVIMPRAVKPLLSAVPKPAPRYHKK